MCKNAGCCYYSCCLVAGGKGSDSIKEDKERRSKFRGDLTLRLLLERKMNIPGWEIDDLIEKGNDPELQRLVHIEQGGPNPCCRFC